MPCDYRKYPKNWFSEIRPEILERAGNCCEGIPAYPLCRARNRIRHPVTRSYVVLTIAHMNHDTADNRSANLRALCQRCHNTYDAVRRAGNRWRRRERKNQLPLSGCP
ncbi:MAG: hypothetical protein GY749_38655 [Desulfobacteraceae bacterium]|nr:hypothetical protein [Desulfobacteraceae bacterium]